MNPFPVVETPSLLVDYATFDLASLSYKDKACIAGFETETKVNSPSKTPCRGSSIAGSKGDLGSTAESLVVRTQ